MPDYSKGKIYKLWSPSTGLTYVGSTCQTLAMRLGEHRRGKGQYDRDPTKKYVSSYKVIGCPDYRIDLIEEYPCENKMQLNKREGEFILASKCVNRCVAGRTDKQYRETNIEMLRGKDRARKRANKEKTKLYILANRDRIERRNGAKYTCSCGATIRKDSKYKHEKSQKHIDNLPKIE